MFVAISMVYVRHTIYSFFLSNLILSHSRDTIFFMRSLILIFTYLYIALHVHQNDFFPMSLQANQYYVPLQNSCQLLSVNVGREFSFSSFISLSSTQ